ncbi:P-loop containing nucleoside triphosphate hydrolase protein [Parathielavia appendiculata]|uniref:P-loop containing nucleoside triphosphate hydrolase protein n=1 Tax=Parathielavia appendiculata TaxID=2587402 RepID=A0AAN6YYR3_9PEZI|nr:P-loop containing nucleoside triphosphate hydrolase protein [Parathielavia appendiculata]
MEQFLLENTERYKRLVAAFKPSALDKKGINSAAASPEIVVCTRVRPMLEDEVAEGFPCGVYPRGATNTVDLHELKRPVRGLPTLSSSHYTVDRVFGPEDSTADVYESVVKPIVPWAWGGGIATVFCYGQTASGKSYTTAGLEKCVAESLMGGSLDGERKIYISVVELAGRTAYDLLNERKEISILEDSFGTTQLAGALEHRVANKESLLGHIEAAAGLRRTAPTLKNDNSSRSHAICRLRFENPAMKSAEEGLLYLIDLAGSEAARDKTTHDATRMKEAKEINTSLSVLKDCIRGRALADAEFYAGRISKAPAYIPFRQSILTKTLKHVFDPTSTRSCKTVVVACVNPCLADIGASKNTLRYAEMLRVVGPKPKMAEYDPWVPATWNNEQLQSWIESNSGQPPIDPLLLAPSESGLQLLRLPIPEFLTRCLKTEGATPEQAQAFQTKFWAMHVDSQRRSRYINANKAAGDGKAAAAGDNVVSRLASLDSSADPEPDAGSVPFKERIRPGMVVRWQTRPEYGSFAVGGKAYAMVMCPVHAVGERVRDVKGVQVNPQSEDAAERKGETYLCALVTPSLLPGSYGISLWRQVVVKVEDMVAEVLMEWDEATRYYYMTV